MKAYKSSEGLPEEKPMYNGRKTNTHASEYTFVDETATEKSYSVAELEYIEFLREWGHIDFSLLNFLPQILTVEELHLLREERDLESKVGRKHFELLN